MQKVTDITAVLKEFYTALKAKSVDKLLRFLFVTGVTSFSNVDMFSGANNILDYTWKEETASLMGFTETELSHYFDQSITELEANPRFKGKFREKAKQLYNGYLFCDCVSNAESVYNPYSITRLFTEKKFDNYWIKTGPPNFLIQYIKSNK